MSGYNSAGKVAWLCSYVPAEIIRAAGWEPFRPLVPAENPARADGALSPNLCPYVRRLAAALDAESRACPDLQGLIVAHSCNAMLHLYNVLRKRGDLFCYLLDLPRQPGPAAEDYFTAELARLADFLSVRGRPVSAARLQAAIAFHRKRDRWLRAMHDRLPAREFAALLWSVLEGPAGGPAENRSEKLAAVADTQPPGPAAAPASSATAGDGDAQAGETDSGETTGDGGGDRRPALLLTGAIPPRGLVDLLTAAGLAVIHDHCLGRRFFAKTDQPAPGPGATREELLRYLARRYLGKPPCPRFFAAHDHAAGFQELLAENRVLGVVFHELAFCDLSAYDALQVERLAAVRGIPRLRVKTELGQEDFGQLQTRVQAFLEMIGTSG